MTTGDHQVLSDNVTPSDIDPFYLATSVVFDHAGDRLIVLQRQSFPATGIAAYAVDPLTGSRTVFADGSSPNVFLDHPVSTVIDSVLTRALIADRF